MLPTWNDGPPQARSHFTFTPFRVVLKDERRTSNVQRWTSNNDVAALRNLISFVFKNPMSNLERLFLFPLKYHSLWCSPNAPAAFLLCHKSVSSSFPIQHSMLDVRCSMFFFFSKPSIAPAEKQVSLWGEPPLNISRKWPPHNGAVNPVY